MRAFGLIGLLIVLAIVMYQYKMGLWGLSTGPDYSDSAPAISKSVETEVNSSVAEYQKKLEENMKQSGAQ